MEFYVKQKLVAVNTGEVVGYIYKDDTEQFSLAVTAEKAKDLKLNDADYIEYIDCECVEVVSFGNRYALVDNEIAYLSDDCYDGFIEVSGDRTIVDGNVFDSHKFVELNNEVAINRVLRLISGDEANWV